MASLEETRKGNDLVPVNLANALELRDGLKCELAAMTTTIIEEISQFWMDKERLLRSIFVCAIRWDVDLADRKIRLGSRFLGDRALILDANANNQGRGAAGRVAVLSAQVPTMSAAAVAACTAGVAPLAAAVSSMNLQRSESPVPGIALASLQSPQARVYVTKEVPQLPIEATAVSPFFGNYISFQLPPCCFLLPRIFFYFFLVIEITLVRILL